MFFFLIEIAFALWSVTKLVMLFQALFYFKILYNYVDVVASIRGVDWDTRNAVMVTSAQI